MTTVSRPARKKATRKPTGDVRAQTLTQFATELDTHAGTQVGFAELVATLYVTRARLARLESARHTLFEVIKAAYNAGHRTVAGTGYELRSTTASEPRLYKAVDSAAAKKASPAAWDRAKTAVNFVQAAAPDAVAQQLAAVIESDPIPAVDRITALPAAVATYREHPAWDTIKELRDIEVDTIERLDKIGSEFGWDGLPIIFADGWRCSLRRRQYSSEQLAAVEPELFDRLATLKVAQQAPRVYIALAGDDSETRDLDGD